MVNKLKELRNSGSEEGFTLIELMIVVVIIGILAAIAIPIFMNQQRGAIVAGVKSDVKNTNTNIATALVKAPTASKITNAGIEVTPAVTGATPTPAVNISFDIVKSDTNTVITIDGGWNTYYVLGTNSSIKAATPKPTTAPVDEATQNIAAGTGTTFGVLYSVATGKTVTKGD